MPRLPPGTTVVIGPAALARALRKDLRAADGEIIRLQEAAEAAGLHDCAASLRRADAQIIVACSALGEDRTDTDLARQLGTHDKVQAA